MKLFTLILLFISSIGFSQNDHYGYRPTDATIYDQPNINGKETGVLPAYLKVPIVKIYKPETGRLTEYYQIVYEGKPGFVRATGFELSERASYFFDKSDSLSIDSAIMYEKVFRKRHKDDVDKILNAWEAAGLRISEWTWNDDDYGSISIDFTLTNFDKKRTVKYIYITLSAWNPVNDKIGNNKTVTLVGPLTPYAEGSYEFDNVLRSKVVDKVKIVSVKVLYMDGSIRMYDTPAKIKSIL